MKTKIKKLKKGRLNAFTLTELLVVLVIIGILVLLALPNQGGVINSARATEAKLQLKQVWSLQEAYHYANNKYSSDIAEIGFEQSKLITNDGDAYYQIEIVDAGKSNFKVRATAVVDFDDDGTMNVWEMDQEKKLEEVTKD